jgi:hypothetical protein
MTPSQRAAAEWLAGELDRIGRHQPGVLMADDGSVWHPANLLLPAAALLRELAEEPVQAEPVQEHKLTTASQFESVKEAKRVAEYELKYYRKMMGEKIATEPVQEPIAWYTEDHLTDRSATTYSKDVVDRWRSKGWPTTPLYTHQPQQRKPLTDEQIAEMSVQEQFLLVCDGIEELTEIVRAVERAHGITGEPT